MHGLLLAAVVALASAAPIPTAPTRWVTDSAGFMTPAARSALDVRLEAYERATGHQIVVWIGTTIGDAALDDWAVRTFAAWKIGRAGLDDGIAVFVLTEDRKIDIEVGYGLEGLVPDAVASRIIREVMAPQLRAGKPDAAITDGVNALLSAIEGKPWAGGAMAPQPEQGRPLLTYILGGLALIAFLILLVVHPQAALMLLWSIASSRGGGSIGSGGGGGFGGGGGRSGGGGARGGW